VEWYKNLLVRVMLLAVFVSGEIGIGIGITPEIAKFQIVSTALIQFQSPDTIA